MSDTIDIFFDSDGPTIICRWCAQAQPLDCFGRDKRGRYGRENRCKACSRLQHKGSADAKRQLGPKPRGNYHCPICGKSNEYDDWAPDHDRLSGEAREWLCRGCNTSLGKFGDDPVILARAILYLGKHGKLLPEIDLAAIAKREAANDRPAEAQSIILSLNGGF